MIGEVVTVAGRAGLAFRVVGPEMADTEETIWDGIQEPTGMVIVRAIGDDRSFTVDPADCTPLAEGGFCLGCGATDCRACGDSE